MCSEYQPDHAKSKKIKFIVSKLLKFQALFAFKNKIVLHLA